MTTEATLYKAIVDLIIDYAIEDEGYTDGKQRLAMLKHLEECYNTAEEWNPPLKEVEIGELINEIRLSVAAFSDGWDAALSHCSPKMREQTVL